MIRRRDYYGLLRIVRTEMSIKPHFSLPPFDDEVETGRSHSYDWWKVRIGDRCEIPRFTAVILRAALHNDSNGISLNKFITGRNLASALKQKCRDDVANAVHVIKSRKDYR